MKKKISPKNRDYYESIVPEINNLKKNGLINSYIGNKGYSIYKISLNTKIIEFIKKELTVKPFMQSSLVDPKSFSIYLESDKKIYVPRFWGINIFGNPKMLKISFGKSINLHFNGILRDYQNNVLNAYLKTINFEEKEEANVGNSSALIELWTGAGKCMGINTPIIMYNGDIKMVQDIKVGDQLMGDDSTPRNVLSLARGREMMYDIIPTKGDKYTVNESHILSLKMSSSYNNKKYNHLKKNDIYDLSLVEYLNLPKGLKHVLKGYRVGVEFTYKKIDIEPYFLGLWLGDETSSTTGISTTGISTTGISTVDNCVINYINEYSERLNSRVVICNSNKRRGGTYSIVNSSINKVDNFNENNKLLNMLRNHNLLLNKHIPKIYKCNSRQIRLELLAGIIDSVGNVSKMGYNIIQKNETLLDNIIYVARSLGFAAYKKICKKTCIYKGEKKEEVYYRTNIHGKGLEDIPVKIKRKKFESRGKLKNALNIGIKVEKREIDNYYGFELDGNRRYLLGDYTVTHNTVLALKIVEVIKKKTIIFVHKTFLKNQWIERINEYLPDAKIGCIQGQIIDIEDKDIVIAMIQSISMKSYPDSLFNDFGLSIYDECFKGDTLIYTNRGKKKISELYNTWILKDNIEILSFNRETKTFEYKPLTFAWKKESRDFIKFTLSKQKLECTLNHKILTPHGYIEANKLEIGSLILGKYDINNKNNFICPCLNEDQLQIIYGSYLGNGSLITSKKNRYKLRIVHCKDHYEYCNWKAEMFNIYNVQYIKKNEYSQKEAYCFNTRCFDLINDLSDKKNIPDWLVEKIDARGIAIWFMDDGYLLKGTYKDGTNTYFAKIRSNNFDYENNNKIKRIFSKFHIEIEIEIRIYKTRNYYEISFNKENTIKLLDLIRNYNHSNMNYKLDSFSNNKYTWNNKFLNYGTMIITSKEYINDKLTNVYDIEVKDNHNFILASQSKSDYINGPIVSNCHHISSEVFSNCLRKCTTLYGLGLSATMNRKDGLTNVFKMYLGDICYKNKSEQIQFDVLVKAIDYNVYGDDEYNEVARDYRGNVKHTTMLSKVSNFNYRTDFIVNVIENELKINNNQQILLLAHQRKFLSYLFKEIEYRNLGTLGYYIGGMKELDLKASEKNKIILATYQMAAEGLDIKTLTTLILATPKSDIVQSVGRILREKHSNPLIIDIIDQHDCFVSQFAKRKAFYNEKNYKIIRTNNDKYIDYIKYIKKGEEFDENEIWKELVVKSKKNKEKQCLIKI